MDDDEDWDLHAVVRGASDARGNAAAGVEEHDGAAAAEVCFPDIVEGRSASTGMNELEELCKPFFHNSAAATAADGATKMSSGHGGGGVDAAADAALECRYQQKLSQSPRYKRRVRRSQLRRATYRIPIGDISADLFAWRKYGQKPIKGSPYPRGYYKCSSLKGCMARKQVERSPTEPGILIVTYVGDHNHPIPTYSGHSLAGSCSIRRKHLSADAASSHNPALC